MTADSPPSETPEQTSSHTNRQTADWDIRNAPRNYISLVATHGATALFSFVSVWLITRYLGSEGYGGIVAFVAASQLAQIFVNWSSTALARFGIEEFIETGRITRSFWSRTLIFAPNLILVVLLSVFWLRPVAGWLKIPDDAIWLIMVHLVVTSVWLHVQYGLQGVKMLRLQGAMLAAERVLTFFGLLLVIFFGHLNLSNALWCYIGPAVALSAAGFFVLRKFVEFNGFFTRQHFRQMLVYSFPLIPFAIVGYLSTSQLDAFFITRYLTIHDLGIYAVASQINGMVLQLPILANSILLSMFVSLRTSGKDSLISRFLNDIVPSAALVWGVICATGAIIAVILIPVVFGMDFQAAVGPLMVLIMASVVSCLSVFGYATYSHSISATYISTIASILAAVVNVTFNILLIPKWGLVGCAMATFLSQAALGMAVVALCSRTTEVNFRKAVVAVTAPWVAVLVYLFSRSEIAAIVSFYATTVIAVIIIRDALKVSLAYAAGRALGKATTSN